MAQSKDALMGMLLKQDIKIVPKTSGYPTSNPSEQKRKVIPDLSHINLDTSSSFEDVVAEAVRLSESKITNASISDTELEKEILYRLAEDGMINLSREEIDLLFLKRTYPTKPELQCIKEDIDIAWTGDSVKSTFATVLGILGIFGSVWLCQTSLYGPYTLGAIMVTGLSWLYVYHKIK